MILIIDITYQFMIKLDTKKEIVMKNQIGEFEKVLDENEIIIYMKQLNDNTFIVAENNISDDTYVINIIKVVLDIKLILILSKITHIENTRDIIIYLIKNWYLDSYITGIQQLYYEEKSVDSNIDELIWEKQFIDILESETYAG